MPARALCVDLRLRTKGRVYAAHEKGALTQFCTRDHPFAKLVPMFVSLTPIQKTNATRRTTKVYSTRPCPSSSLYSRLNNSILWSSCSDGLLFSRYRPAKTGALSQLIFLRNGVAIEVPEVIPANNHVFLVNTSQARAFTGLIWQFSDKVTVHPLSRGILDATLFFLRGRKELEPVLGVSDCRCRYSRLFSIACINSRIAVHRIAGLEKRAPHNRLITKA